jgi:hypothetical protein
MSSVRVFAVAELPCITILNEMHHRGGDQRMIRSHIYESPTYASKLSADKPNETTTVFGFKGLRTAPVDYT